MTLIELLSYYAASVRKTGNRKEANKFIRDVCDRELWWHIEHSVSDKGEFVRIDDNGNEIPFDPNTYYNNWED